MFLQMSNKAKVTQTNTPGWSAPTDTADMSALRGIRDQGGDFATPIRNAYARAEQKRSNSWNNPLGAYTTADIRDKASREQDLDAQQSMGMDLANAAQQNAESKWGRYAQIAGMTAPQFYMKESSKADKMGALDWTKMGIGTAQMM